eukprot:GHVL01030751.1.p1 GENE.GHVL01030751.1~~GHVL01030751.1.p1  ORF type:complete len:226 (+),score=31.43 GHVL01030751.1:26-703(+)
MYKNCYRALVSVPYKTTGIAFNLKNSAGDLFLALECFKKHNINLTKIESNADPLPPCSAKIHIHFEGSMEDENVNDAITELKHKVMHGVILPLRKKAVPWYPTRLSDLDVYARSVLDAGTDLMSDHPGFHDPIYRKRREEIVQKAETFRAGDELPDVEYTDAENDVWKEVMDQLSALFPTMACREYNIALDKMMKKKVFCSDRIPQIKEVSAYLKGETGNINGSK